MTLHWTYDVASPSEDLRQGDILVANDPLKALVSEIQPNIVDLNALGFVVVTQCCDMARRNGEPCKADFISIAIIRDLDNILGELLNRTCERFGEDAYLSSSKLDATQLLKRILNQNEQALGLFYLHPGNEDDIGLWEASVALLRITVSISNSHYGTLLGARTCRLKSEFRNKVGWLVSNLYSRIGTRDWDPSELGTQVDKLLSNERFIWATESWVKYAEEKTGSDFKQLPAVELRKVLDNNRPAPFREQLGKIGESEFKKIIENLPKRLMRDVVDSLQNNFSTHGMQFDRKEFANLLSECFQSTIQSEMDRLPLALCESVMERISPDATDDALRESVAAVLKEAVNKIRIDVPSRFGTILANIQLPKTGESIT